MNVNLCYLLLGSQKHLRVWDLIPPPLYFAGRCSVSCSAAPSSQVGQFPATFAKP